MSLPLSLVFERRLTRCSLPPQPLRRRLLHLRRPPLPQRPLPSHTRLPLPTVRLVKSSRSDFADSFDAHFLAAPAEGDAPPPEEAAPPAETAVVAHEAPATEGASY